MPKHRTHLTQRLLILITMSLLATTVAFADSDADARHYPLSMARMQSYYDAIMNFAKLSANDPKLEDSLSADGSESADAIIARFEAKPVVKKAVAAAGLTVRQFVYIQTAYMTAAFGAAYQDQTHGKLDAVYDAANVAFYKAHQKDILAMQAKMGEKMKAAGLAPKEDKEE